MPDFSNILFLTDFDLTLTDGVNIPKRNLDAIEYFKQNGGLFGVATGRAKSTFAPQLGKVELNAPCVLSNGALIYDFAKDETLAIHQMSAEQRDKVLRMYNKYAERAIFEVEVGLEIYLPDDSLAINVNDYTRRHFEWVEHVSRQVPLAEIPDTWLKAVFTAAPEEIPAIAEEVKTFGLNGVTSLPFMLEIQPEGIDKGKSARELANMLGRKLVCAGDAPNDLAMLKEADRTFVPSSAYPEILALGFEVVCDCKDGAVADAIERLEDAKWD